MIITSQRAHSSTRNRDSFAQVTGRHMMGPRQLHLPTGAVIFCLLKGNFWCHDDSPLHGRADYRASPPTLPQCARARGPRPPPNHNLAHGHDILSFPAASRSLALIIPGVAWRSSHQEMKGTPCAYFFCVASWRRVCKYNPNMCKYT